MSEQEKKTGGNAGGSTIVMVDQASAHHKTPYRPTELEEEAHDPQHKRTRAPAVPTVAEDIKITEDSNASGVETRELKESDALTTEKKKFGAGKKQVSQSMSSNKKRDPQESSPMAVIEPERKPGASQPIPPDVASSQPTKDKHTDDDSVAEEVAELRTPDTEARHSEWSDKDSQNDLAHQVCAQIMKKSEISWNDEEYLEKVQLQDLPKPSRSVLLERKASVGPYKSRTPLMRPSGLLICMPKKSTRSLKEDSHAVSSGINLSISRNFLEKKKRPAAAVDIRGTGDIEKRAVKVDIEVPYMKVLSAVRSKVDIMRNKIHSVFST